MDNELRIFLARSKIRIETLKRLNEEPQIAIFLAKKIKKHREVISRIFLDLQNQKLAICMNPGATSFRIYEITAKGKKTLKEFLKL
jgi:DNA-binding PadR family transcriptional regulator